MSKFGWYFPIKSVFELHLILAENNANSKIAARKNAKLWLTIVLIENVFEIAPENCTWKQCQF